MERRKPLTTQVHSNKTIQSRATWRDLGVVFGMGYFSLTSQVLLFRIFFTAAESNELGLGIFFGTWLMAVGVGAMAYRGFHRGDGPRRNKLPGMVLWYLPAFLLQAWLLHHTRALLNLPAYEYALSLKLVAFALLANAPVGILTGWLFPLACQQRPHALTQVYATEALGAFTGGLATTALLFFQLTLETVFVTSAGVLSALVLPALVANWSRANRVITLTMALVIFIAGVFLSPSLNRKRQRAIMESVLPAATWEGRFVTPEATYVYGHYHGQFNVVSNGQIAESLPEGPNQLTNAAALLAQHPQARRVAIIGTNSWAIGRAFAAFDQVTQVTLVHPDPTYLPQLSQALPPQFDHPKIRLEAHWPRAPRRAHQRTAVDYDIVMVHLPMPETLAINRFYTQEFFSTLKAGLAPTGIAAVQLRGDDNFTGQALSFMGGSVYSAFKQVFSRVVIKPGETTLLIGANVNGPPLNESAQVLMARYSQLDGASQVFPPAGLGVYDQTRSQQQREAYQDAMGHHSELIGNSYLQPTALQGALRVIQTEQLGWQTDMASFLATRGLRLIIALLLLTILLRFIDSQYRQRPPAAASIANTSGEFTGRYLVFTTGFTGLSSSVLLMFAFQSRFGSLYLFMGVASAMFMLGLFAGAQLLGKGHHRLQQAPNKSLFVFCIVHLALQATMATARFNLPPTLFALAFLLLGILHGGYVPIAQIFLPPKNNASTFAWLDHFGGMVAGLVTGLLLLPALGLMVSWRVILLIVAGNGVMAVINMLPRLLPGPASSRFGGKGNGTIPYGVILILTMAFYTQHQLTDFRDQQQAQHQAQHQAQQLISPFLTKAKFALAPTESFKPHRLGGQTVMKNPEGDLIFDTGHIGAEAYGGPIVLGIRITATGTIEQVAVIDQRETPSYLAMVTPWLRHFFNRSIYDADALTAIDGVSGATVTAEAVRHSIINGGKRLQSATTPSPTSPSTPAPIERTAMVLFAVFVAMGLALRQWPQRWIRRMYLLAVVAVFGLWLNQQFSCDHIFRLAQWQLPPVGMVFILTVIVPALTVAVGNIYCGHLCPFGALQELIADVASAIIPRRRQPKSSLYRIKYLLLILFLLLLLFPHHPALVSNDPLTAFFAPEQTPFMRILTIAIVLSTIAATRFFCQYLCPTGAFLALLGQLNLTRQLWRPVSPARCDLDAHHSSDSQCIQCTRCHIHPHAIPVHRRAPARITVVSAVVLALAIATGALMTTPWSPQPQHMTPRLRASAHPLAGQPRPVNMKRLKNKLHTGQLSRHKALYCQPLPESAHPPPPASPTSSR